MRPLETLREHSNAIIRELRRRQGRRELLTGSGAGGGAAFATFRVRAYTGLATPGIPDGAIAGRKILADGSEEGTDTTVFVRVCGEGLIAGGEWSSLAPTVGQGVTRQAVSPRVAIGSHIVAWYGTTRYGVSIVVGWHKVGDVEKYNC